MKNWLSGIILAITGAILFNKIAYADLINPEYYSKTCKPGEMEIQCSYKSTQPFGPKTYNECAKYENNPAYKYLTGEGHSFGGRSKYCYKATSIENYLVYHIRTLLPLLLITLLLEIPLFLLMISKTRKGLLTVVLANLISVPLLYIATVLLPFTGFLLMLTMELTVIIFETLFIKFIYQDARFGKVLTYSFFANITSAIFGNVLLNLISGLLKI